MRCKKKEQHKMPFMFISLIHFTLLFSTSVQSCDYLSHGGLSVSSNPSGHRPITSYHVCRPDPNDFMRCTAAI